MAAGDSSRYVLSEGELLDARGNLKESGYAFSQVKSYSRAAVKKRKLRIKEWDYYYFCDGLYGVALTVADNSYMSLGSVSVLDFSRLTYITESKMGLFPKGKLKMPETAESGDVRFDKDGVRLEFVNDGGRRALRAHYRKFDGKNDFDCEITLEPPKGDNITVAVPFAKPGRFYYNTKINCLKGVGSFSIGDTRHEFSSGSGGLDWGRGVWPYKNVWYWSSLSTEIDGTPFGFNLGYGFGKPLGTENVIFYGGKAHKLNKVVFEIPYTAGAVDYL